MCIFTCHGNIYHVKRTVQQNFRLTLIYDPAPPKPLTQ